MDWNTIETFLKDSVWGMIILGALGSGLVLLILNIYGRANKGYKWLWKFYKGGIDSTVIELFNNKDRFKLFRHKANRRYIMACVFLILGFLVLGIFNLTRTSDFALGVIIFCNIGLWVIVEKESTIIKKVYRKRIYHEGWEEEGDENP